MPQALKSLQNVGPATLEDLRLLGISSVADLRQADPDELYHRLCEITGKHQDPCVWDVFAAIIHEARTQEKTPWWHWTPIRKNRSSSF